MKKIFSIITVLLLFMGKTMAQHQVTLDAIFQQIQKENPSLKMYDAEIHSQDEAAKGAHNWSPPEIGGGLWMVPYNPSFWKKGADGTSGMGQFMVSALQMFPNKRKQDAEAKYMEAASSVDTEKRKASLNELYAMAKKNYYEWVMIKRKIKVIDQNENLLNFMIQNAEIRYKNGLEKISAYYKAKAALGNLQNIRLVLVNDIKQKQVILNTLMSRDQQTAFDIDTLYQVKDYSSAQFAEATLLNSRSDVKAVEQNIQLTLLQQAAEGAKLKPEFGITYNHMFGFGGIPMQYTLMGTMKIPMAKWSSKTVKANIESLRWKTESYSQQKKMLLNEAGAAASSMKNDIELKKKQLKLFNENIIPALKRNFKVMQLAYEQNTEQLFTLYDAWETLNMTQLEYLEQLQQLLLMQVELERILEIQ